MSCECLPGVRSADRVAPAIEGSQIRPMASLRYQVIRPLLFSLDPETAHRLAINVLNAGIFVRPPSADPRLSRRLLGLDFPNPLGLAAGFDKNAEVPNPLLSLGFGFVEVGTVTPRAQTGNPKPRLFRLEADRAIINRLGFNTDGHDVVAERLARRRNGIVGVNVGANRDSADRIADYAAGAERFAGIADYLTVNVSSPNTPGLRDLQERTALAELLSRVVAAGLGRAPILLKIAPDIDRAQLEAITETAVAAKIDGIVVTNTTTARDGLSDKQATETGGLSGRPLFKRSTVLLAQLRKLVGRKLVLVGAGGIDSAEAAFSKIKAGADLVQLYTGMIFEGPSLPRRVVEGLSRLLEREGLSAIEKAVGAEADRWAAGG